MIQKPKIFIGSSSELKTAAVKLQSFLIEEFDVSVWNQDIFELNKSTLESLFKMLDNYDFACFIIAGEDILEKRGKQLETMRDNVLFEIGLCLGRFGSDRVFILYSRDRQPSFPTDLSGITFLPFKQHATDIDFSKSLADPANTIKNLVTDIGIRKERLKLRHENILKNSDSGLLSHMTDAALLITHKRYGYTQDILDKYVSKNIVVPSRYFYVTDEGAALWLTMAHDPAYRYNKDSEKLLERNGNRIVQKIMSIAGTDGIDFISVGSGDGKKDRILLKYLTSHSSKNITYYYPLDISDKLLVECISNIAKAGYPPSRFRIKGIIGDFQDLSTSMSIYENRPTPNLFSILGNTIGNSDETELIDELRRSLFTGDFVLIDVNINIADVDDGESFYKSKLVSEYSFLPLSLLGVPFEIANLLFEPRNLSHFKSARSSVTVYKEAMIGNKKYENIQLSYDHRYDFANFQKEFCDELDLELLFSDALDSAGMLLAVKR